jgi:hypothetical protein
VSVSGFLQQDLLFVGYVSDYVVARWAWGDGRYPEIMEAATTLVLSRELQAPSPSKAPRQSANTITPHVANFFSGRDLI